jgi:hypothetical protein
MSFAALSHKSVAAPASRAKSAAAPTSDLQVGEADDAFEREADRMADGVLARGTFGPQWSLARVSGSERLQRSCACGGSTDSQEECAACKEKKTLRRKSTGSASRSAPRIVDEVLRSPGTALDAATREFFERRFHHDFSQVRIHTDTNAGASARAVDALAYTVGNHVVFGAGNYDLRSLQGRRLMAHELAHTIQQAPILRRASIGWSSAPTGSRNVGESSVGNVRRIAVEGLSQGFQSPGTSSPSGRAIVLIQSSAGSKPFDPAKPVDVLLHFHGWDASYEQNAAKKYKDIDVFKIERQLEAAGNPQVVGILPQGDSRSSFGNAPANSASPSCDPNNTKGFDSDAFIQEIFAAITANGKWSNPGTVSPKTAPSVAGVMISGHSGAGELINENLLGGAQGSSLPAKLGQLKEVALFDAINGPCEFLMVTDWLERTLTKELGDLKGKKEADQLQYLKGSMRFRSYFERSAKAGYYSKWNVGPLPSDTKFQALLAGKKPVKAFLADWFRNNSAALSAAVANEWSSHYAVIDMGQVAHDSDPVNIMTAATKSHSTPLRESIQVLPKRDEGENTPLSADAEELIHRALLGPAQSLQDADRDWAREHFGQDLSHVRIHSDHQAAESARAIRARAFTVGPDIVFASGEYGSRGADGRQLLGHELAHVLQQGIRARRSSEDPPAFSLGSTNDSLERQADHHAVHPGRVQPAADTGVQRVQRAPPEGQLAKSVCETTHNPGNEQAGECNYARPENCPTYESWMATFIRLRSFKARAAPQPADTKGPHTFDVLGGPVPDPQNPAAGIPAAATRPEDKPHKKAPEDPAAPATPATALKLGETFIDHPTDAWVKACLPDNLRATAYQLPADCADIAIILRHVWLSAHHRTQTLRWGKQSWVIGDAKGGAAQDRAGAAIRDIGSMSVQSMVAPYSDAQGVPLLSFKQLEPLLHPGDILVWEHHENGLQKERTGGHTLTITEVIRNTDGAIKSMAFLEGNEPIFGDPGDPAGVDDKGAIIRELKLKDTPAVRKQLGDAPGRRIEAVTSAGLGLTFSDVSLPAEKKGAAPKSVWLWPDATILLAAGPPRASTRPAAAAPAKGAPAIRRLSDWAKSFTGAASYADWQAFFESMVLEARSFVEQGISILESEARQVGEAAGQKIWQLAKSGGDPLGNQGHFARLQAAKATLQAIASSRGAVPKGSTTAQGQITGNLMQVVQWIEDAFELAARGAGDITFGAAGSAVVKILLTGFDPFDPTGNLAPPSKEQWNSAGAAVLALDNHSVPARSSKGKSATARVQGVILPVSYDEFQAGGQGLVEKIVLQRASDMDAAITVSMDASLGMSAPVRLERYVVGTHSIPDAAPSKGRTAKPIPAAGGVGLGAEIIESNAPLQNIAAAAEKPSHGTSAGIPKPTLGEEVTLEFADDKQADKAARVLRGARTGKEVGVSDAAVMQEILATMTRETNGIGITFKVAGSMFKAKVLSGPGGDFLSNEVSYRMLRLLKEKKLSQDPMSFHVHTPSTAIPPNPAQPNSKWGAVAGAAAKGMLSRLIDTLKRLIAATAKEILDRRDRSKP